VAVSASRAPKQEILMVRVRERVGLGGRGDYLGVSLVIVLRPHTPKHIRGGWSHYTDTSEPVAGYGARIMVIVQYEFRTSHLI
jgi:hypothetical protein